MTETDIAHAVKEILGTRVVYVSAFLHLALWISVRNNNEIKRKNVSLIGYIPEHLAVLNLRAKKFWVKTLAADIGSVTFLGKTKPEMHLPH